MGVWQRLRASDQSIMDSRAGWLLPGGAAYRTGQWRGRRGGRRGGLWVLPFGWLDWWNYNVGEERGALQRCRADCAAVVGQFAERLSPATVAELEVTLAGIEPEQAIRSLAHKLVAEQVSIARREFDDIQNATTGRLTYGRIPAELAALVAADETSRKH